MLRVLESVGLSSSQDIGGQGWGLGSQIGGLGVFRVNLTFKNVEGRNLNANHSF